MPDSLASFITSQATTNTPATGETTSEAQPQTTSPFSGQTTAAASNPAASSSSLASFVVSSSMPQDTQEPSVSPFRAKAQSSGGDEPTDPNAPWYKKAWDWANTPLVDEQSIENWTGRSGKAGGLEKGFYDLVSGLTSPLSVALALGTFGSGSLFESGGAAALRAAGMGAEDIANITKGSEIFADALKAGKSQEQALGAITSAGLNADKVQSGLEVLSQSGLTGEALLNHGIIRQAGASMLRGLNLPVAQAEKVATGVQALVDAGFTAQNAYGAIAASPRVLDALKEGDYETAKRLAVNALGGAAFATLGARSLFKEAGGLMDEASAKAGLHVVPTEEVQSLRKEFGKYNRGIVQEGQAEKLWETDLRDQFKDFDPSARARVMKFIQAGLDDSVLAQRHDYLAEAGGVDKRIAQGVDNGLNIPIRDTNYTVQRSQEPVNLTDPNKPGTYHEINLFDKSGKNVGNVELVASPQTKAVTVKGISGPGYGKALYNEAVKFAHDNGAKYLESSYTRTDDSLGTWKRIKALRPEAVETLSDGRDRINLDKLYQGDGQSVFRMGDSRIRELIDRGDLKKNRSPEEIKSLLDSYDATKLTDRERELAKIIANHMGETYEKAHAAGALDEAVENYAPQIWEKEEANEASNRLSHEARTSGFATNTSMARERVFMSAFEGELLGKKLAITDPIQLAAHNGNTFGRVIEARKTLDRLQDTNVRASDGRPLVVPAGSSARVITTPDGQSPAYLAVNPGGMRTIRIADKVIQGLIASRDLTRLVKEGKIVEWSKDKAGNPRYAWNPQDYLTVPHPAFKDWMYVSQDTGGRPVMVKADLLVHPEAHEYLQKQLGLEKSVLDKGVGKALLATGREAKGILLAFSPFHVIQEGLRAVISGVSPFGVERWDLRNDPVLAKGVENGLTLGRDLKGAAAFEEGRMSGHSKILSKFPGLGTLQDYLQSFLFDKYIPGLKARAYRALAKRYESAYPDWSPSKVAETAAADTNERFGGINYKRMGRSVATQDLFRIVALAPDWLESEVRFMARVFGEEGKVARFDVARAAVGLWGAARIMNLMLTGDAHNEAPFGVVHKDKDGKEKVYSVRTLPTDMLHAVSDPGGFLTGRASPLFRSAVEAYTGRDEYGRREQTHNIAADLLRNVAPIPAQTIAKVVTGETPDVSNADALIKATGGTVFPYRTEAQKLAAKLASDHSESGVVDKASLRRHQALLHLADQLRSGDMRPEDVFTLVEQGDMSVKEGKQALKEAQETKGMDPDTARLWIRASRLPMPEMLQVWDAAGNNEKASLSKLLIRKRIAYYRKAMREMTPQQRSSDPTYQRLRQMFPSESPF